MNNNCTHGPISTSIPGKKGETGKRSRLTYVATYTHGTESEEYVLSQLTYDNESIGDAIDLDYYTPTDDEGQIKITYPYPSDKDHITVPESSDVGKGISGNILKWDNAWRKPTIDTPSSLASDESIRPNYKFYEEQTDSIDSSIGYVARIKNTSIKIICDEIETTNPSITNTLDIYPEVGDYIIFVDKNSTYILLIEKVEYGNYQSVTRCYCKVLDAWNKDINDAQQIINTTEITDNINIYCTNYDFAYNKLTDDINDIYDRKPNIEYTHTSDILKNFLIISKNNNYTLGNYKIELEFLSVYNTPIMHSTIADYFSNSDNYFFGDISKYDRTHNRVYENIKFTKSSFDDEKLDNFTIIIKDYNEGVNSSVYNSTVKIPVKYLNAFKNDYPNIHLYIYVKKLNGSINKILIGEFNVDSLLNWNDKKEAE